MKILARRIFESGAVHVFGAFVLMGSWAVFANWAYPMPRPLIAGFVQGTMSGIITLGLKHLLEMLVKRLSDLWALLVPPLFACGLSITILGMIHSIAGTPEILATLVVPVSVATLYAAVYTFGLWSKKGEGRDG